MSKQTLVISGFPGVGKSYLFNNKSNLQVLDSDSSNFSWIEKGVRHPDFPNNYIKHIKENIGVVDIILVSSHKVVRDALKENNIKYDIYYPSIESKEIYVERYRNRGNEEGFIKLVNENWDSWIHEIEEETFPTKIKMEGNSFLKDYFIPTSWENVMDSRHYYPCDFYECREIARSKNYKFFGFNGAVFRVDDEELNYTNAVCSEYDLK